MPVDFLTDEQARRYGRYNGDPTPEQLARYFYLSRSDHDEINIRRRDYNRLGYTIQLCTVRFLGTFLPESTAVPPLIIKHLSRQLEINPACLPHYQVRSVTHHEHAREIQERHGYREFTDQPGHLQLVRWLYTRAWLSAERPIVLFDLTTARLTHHKILLPGVTTLTRLVAQVRERAAVRLWRMLSGRPDPQQRVQLLGLLEPAEGGRLSRLEKLRRAPTRISSVGMVDALERLSEFRSLGVSSLSLLHVPPGRLDALARYAAAARAQSIERMVEDRRIATLLAFAQVYESVAQDDAIDLLHQLIAEDLARAENRGEQQRLRTLPELDAAALRLRALGLIVLDGSHADDRLRAAIFARIPRPQLEADIETIGTLSCEEETHYEHLRKKYSQVRRFLPTLLRTVRFDGNNVGKPVVEAFDFLRKLEDAPKNTPMESAPREVLTPAWRKLVE